MKTYSHGERKVYWLGPISGNTGYEEEGRATVAAIRLAGFSVSEFNIPHPGTFDRVSDMQYTPIVITDSDPSSIFIYHRYWPAAPLPNRGFHIWRTMFETSSIHPEWRQCAEQYDAIWVPSQFNYETFCAGGVPPAKLRKLPCPIPDWSDELTQDSRRELRTSHSPFLFLSVMRWQERKGWDILVKAFVGEFGDDPNFRLLIKATPFDTQEPQIPQQELRNCLKALNAFPTENIELLTDSLSVHELIELYRSADAFVLSSRGEGWGRPFIEAMLCGLPTIGSRWSAHLEYMNQQNSLLVSGRLTPVAPKAVDEWRYFERQFWFEPSITSLRKCMRTVVETGGLSWQRRQETVRELLSRYSASSIAEHLRVLLLAIPPDGSNY